MTIEPIKGSSPVVPPQKSRSPEDNGVVERVKRAVVQVFKTLVKLALLPISTRRNSKVQPMKEAAGENPLITAVLSGDLKAATEALEGALPEDIHAVDASGYTAMYYAVASQQVDLIELLGSSPHCDPNRGGRTTPLRAAIAGGNEGVVKALLDLGKTDPNRTHDKKALPLELALTKFIDDHDARIVKLLLEDPRIDLSQVDLRTYNLQGPEFKDVKKLLSPVSEFAVREKLPVAAHVLDISGRARFKVDKVDSVFKRQIAIEEASLRYGAVQPLDQKRVKRESGSGVELEGAPTARLFYAKIAKSLKGYPAAGDISEAYRFCSAPHSSQELLERIKEGKLTFIETGFKNHSVTALFWGDHFVLCNRGEASRRPMEVYRFDRGSLSKECIEEVMRVRNLPQKSYQNLFFKDLPQTLKFKRQPLLEKTGLLPPQTVGNCTWKSSETGVYAALMLMSGDKAVSNPERRQLFWNWLSFQQVKAVESLMKLPGKTHSTIDPRVYRQAFCNARATLLKSDDMDVQKKLQELKDDYIQRLSSRGKLRFKVAWIASKTNIRKILS